MIDVTNISLDINEKKLYNRKNRFEFYVIQKKYNNKKFYAVKSKKTFQELLKDKNIDLFKNFDFEKDIGSFNEITFGLPISKEKTKEGQDFLRFFYELHKKDYTWSIRPVFSFFCTQYDTEKIIDGNLIKETIFERGNKFGNIYDSEIVFENDLFFVKEHVMKTTYENDLVPYAIKCKHNNSYYCYYMNDEPSDLDQPETAGADLVRSSQDIASDSERIREPLGTAGLPNITTTSQYSYRESSILGSDDNTYFTPVANQENNGNTNTALDSMGVQIDNSIQAEFRTITPVEQQPSIFRTLTPVSQNIESIIEQQTSPIVTQHVIDNSMSDVHLSNREDEAEVSNRPQQALDQIQSEINNLQEGEELFIETTDEPPVPLDTQYCRDETDTTSEIDEQEVSISQDSSEIVDEVYERNISNRKKTFRLYGLKEFAPIYFKELQDQNDACREGFINFINNSEDFEIRLLKEIDFQIKDVAKIDAKDVKLKIKDLSPEYKKLYI